jgi:hypothetical protein
MEDGQSSGLFSLDGRAYRAIVAPIRAPAVIGYIVSPSIPTGAK